MMARLFLLISFSLQFIAAIGGDTPASLSARLCQGMKTDKEKVTAIFHWIADHISYTITPAQNPKWLEDDEESLLSTLDDRVAAIVIKRGTAFCDGYARLFKSLADHAGLKAVVIPGYARSGWRKTTGVLGVNHYWNAVYFDSAWHLLDATWASGYVTWRDDQFVRSYEPGYFLANPSQFIIDHYPDDPRWTLLPDQSIPKELLESPFRQKAYCKYQIVSYNPSSGQIHCRTGDTLFFEVEVSGEKQRDISADVAIDSSLYTYSDKWHFIDAVPGNRQQGKYHYKYTISSPGVQWVFLLYNQDLVLRYQVIAKDD
jgi:transglutaminase/protease-like cytokinesis protein 3